jgi:hypothetical protein
LFKQIVEKKKMEASRVENTSNSRIENSQLASKEYFEHELKKESSSSLDESPVTDINVRINRDTTSADLVEEVKEDDKQNTPKAMPRPNHKRPTPPRNQGDVQKEGDDLI